MQQDEINKKVFVFGTTHGDLLESQEELTEIQKALKHTKIMKDLQLNLIPSYRFFQIKKCASQLANNNIKYTIQFIDISSKIFYDEIKAQSRFMTVINSTISHEMRNPLNSILSQNYVH